MSLRAEIDFYERSNVLQQEPMLEMNALHHVEIHKWDHYFQLDRLEILQQSLLLNQNIFPNCEVHNYFLGVRVNFLDEVLLLSLWEVVFSSQSFCIWLIYCDSSLTNNNTDPRSLRVSFFIQQSAAIFIFSSKSIWFFSQSYGTVE